MQNDLLVRRSALSLLFGVAIAGCGGGDDPSSGPKTVPADVAISQTDCSAAKIGADIPSERIGEPVSGVTLAPPTWIAATETVPAHCLVEGAMHPVDPAAPDIEFAVRLPAVWVHRAVQQGGSGSNGVIPNLMGNGYLGRGWAVLGSDSGHKRSDTTWAIHEEAYKNFGYMQMKKTHDAAWEVINRIYGSKPVYSYWVGGSTGGREGLTVAQKYPADYDGVVATVPVINFTSLQLSQVLRRIQEKPLAVGYRPRRPVQSRRK